MLIRLIFTSATIHFAGLCGWCQPQDDPVKYLDYFMQRDLNLAQNYLAYMVAAAHSNTEPGVSEQRKKVVEEVDQLRSELSLDLPYHNDDSLLTAYRDYANALFEVFNLDYAHLENGEQGLGDPVGKMRQLLVKKEAAAQKVSTTSRSKQEAIRNYASRYNIMLLASDRDLAAQVDRVVSVSIYYNRIYLIFYHSVNREMALIESFDQKDPRRIGVTRDELLQVASSGLLKLDSLGPYDSDPSLLRACRQMLQFHRTQAGVRCEPLVDFVSRQEQFNAFKAGFSTKGPSERTKAEVEEFNRMVRELNEASDAASRVIADLNTDRLRLTEQWNSTVNAFLRSHIR
jgi:hypothetical protein